MKIELSGPNASIYVIQASTNLIDWTSIATNFATLGNVVLTDPLPTNAPACFYRAMVPPATNVQQSLSGGKKNKTKAGQQVAQSFRHGAIGSPQYGISRIVFWISKDSPEPNGSLIFSISTGIDSNAVAGSTFAIVPESVTNNSGGSSFQRYEVVYPEPIGPFTAGTTYYLRFNTQSANGKEYWLERSSKSAYSEGKFYRARRALGMDMKFEIQGQ